MIEAMDGLIRGRVAQPAVDAFGIDPGEWSGRVAIMAASAFVVSCLAIATLLLWGNMAGTAAATVALGGFHAASVIVDARRGVVHRDHPLTRSGRILQLGEMAGAMLLLAFVASYGMAAPTAAGCVLVIALVLAVAVAYVSICDRPPPPRRNASRTRPIRA